MSCSCCGNTCIEIKCSYSINYTEPNEHNLDYLYKDGDVVKLKQNHKYFQNQNCLLCGLDYTWNGDRQNILIKNYGNQ